MVRNKFIFNGKTYTKKLYKKQQDIEGLLMVFANIKVWEKVTMK